MQTGEPKVSPALVGMVQDVLVELEDERITRFDAVEALVHICCSVDANARGIGKLKGEEVVLDAIVHGGLPVPEARDWLAVVREKLEAARAS